MVSSLFIGTSFTLKKKSLMRAAVGTRAGMKIKKKLSLLHLNFDLLVNLLLIEFGKSVRLLDFSFIAHGLKLQCLYGCTILAINDGI